MNERVGHQLFPDDAGNFRPALELKPFTLHGAGVGADKAQRLLEHIGQLAGDVAAIDIALVLDLWCRQRRRP